MRTPLLTAAVLAALALAGPARSDDKLTAALARLLVDPRVPYLPGEGMPKHPFPRTDLGSRTRSANNLKQIALAMHNFHDANNGFPAQAILDAKGKALLSWRVAILPYVEEENLYRQFKLDEPWDSEHNKKLLPLMPRIYAPAMNRAKADPEKTFYRVFTGKKSTVFDAKGPSRYTIANIPDGTSNTVLVAEAGDAVPWTKPDELAYDPKAAVPKLGGQFRNVFLVLMFDGSVRAVSRSVKEQTLRNAIEPDDGNVLGDF